MEFLQTALSRMTDKSPQARCCHFVLQVIKRVLQEYLQHLEQQVYLYILTINISNKSKRSWYNVHARILSWCFTYACDIQEFFSFCVTGDKSSYNTWNNKQVCVSSQLRSRHDSCIRYERNKYTMRKFSSIDIHMCNIGPFWVYSVTQNQNVLPK